MADVDVGANDDLMKRQRKENKENGFILRIRTQIVSKVGKSDILAARSKFVECYVLFGVLDDALTRQMLNGNLLG